MEVHRLLFFIKRVDEICVYVTEIPYHKRAMVSVGYAWLQVAVNREAVKIRKIFKDTVGFCYYSNDTNLKVAESVKEECGTERLVWYNYAALDPDTTKRYRVEIVARPSTFLKNRITVVHWYFRPNHTRGDEITLHALPITFKVEETEALPDDWIAFDFEYCHQVAQ